MLYLLAKSDKSDNYAIYDTEDKTVGYHTHNELVIATNLGIDIRGYNRASNISIPPGLVRGTPPQGFYISLCGVDEKSYFDVSAKYIYTYTLTIYDFLNTTLNKVTDTLKELGIYNTMKEDLSKENIEYCKESGNSIILYFKSDEYLADKYTLTMGKIFTLKSVIYESLLTERNTVNKVLSSKTLSITKRNFTCGTPVFFHSLQGHKFKNVGELLLSIL